MYGYIYKITNLVTNKIYIGRTVKTIEQRFSEHCRVAFNDKIKKKLKIQNSIRKYGIDNFKLELLEACESKDTYDAREQYYINLYDARNPQIGYNVHEGGEGGITYVGKKIASENQLKSLEAGRHLPASEKQKQQLKERRTGIQVTDVTRDRLKAAMSDRIHMHKDTKNVNIKIEFYDEYIKQGYERGYYRKQKEIESNN